MKTPPLLLWMVLAIGAVAVIAYWDEQREFAAALKDFAGEQTVLARAIATTLRTELTRDALASSAAQATAGSQADPEIGPRRVFKAEHFS